jgi:hypothetical protein
MISIDFRILAVEKILSGKPCVTVAASLPIPAGTMPFAQFHVVM